MRYNVFTPDLFRFLPSPYVKEFFESGKLRLSSFDAFSKHTDEQRLDGKEGIAFFVLNGENSAFHAWLEFGKNAYVLSTSTVNTPQLLESFDCDSYIRISETVKFGEAVGRKIPNLVNVTEGPCLYQDKKIIYRPLGDINLDSYSGAKDPKLTEHVRNTIGQYPFFLKDKTFKHQMEYRYLWLVDKPVSGHIDIVVPEARQFCTKPNSLTE